MKKILLASDGSRAAENAARFLAHLPHDEKIELTVVSVLLVPQNHQSYPGGMRDSMESYREQERKSVDEGFARIQAIFDGANVSLTHVRREGHPGVTLAAIASELQAELLVIGATGHSAISRMLLGSTSDYVATHSPCSVLVVRLPSSLEMKQRIRIAIGVDDSAPAQAAIQEFGKFRWVGKADVQVVSIQSPLRYYDLPDMGPTEKLVSKTVETLQETVPSTTGRVSRCDHVGEGLVKFVEEEDIDLMVLGETLRTRWGRVLMGSTTRYVLRHSPCSVWITRNRMIASAAKGNVELNA